MITNVEVEVELSAQEVIERLFPRSADRPGEYRLIYVQTEGHDWGRKPIQNVRFRLRRQLPSGVE